MRKALITLVVFAATAALAFAGSAAAVPGGARLPEAITAATPCPVAGCTQEDGACHAATPAPEPDATFEMLCPKVKGCADVTCHAWDRLTSHYNRPSDNSLNLWILAPVLFTVALVLIVRKMR
jgi:hypothetical protein